jgi:4-amino-4-deoxy-L-arabinose transferase-like glycosyltransferase
MTVSADRVRSPPVPVRVIAAWNAATARWRPVAAIVVAWAALSLPLVFCRGFNADEGVAVSIARTALDDGHWLTPYMFNLRFVERPTLLSWIIAAISAPFGHVSEITARVPIVLFLLFGCLLIYYLLRRVAASVPAALVAIALFLACPLVIRSYVMITADLPLAVLLFFAFVLWWDGYAKESIGVGRWAAIGVVLAFAGLLKGPQPLGYFALGIGVFVVATQSWRQIPGLLLAGVICALPLAAWYALVYTHGDEANWASFMRVHPINVLAGPLNVIPQTLIAYLPAVLLAGAFLIAQAFRSKRFAPPGFVPALACYAFTAAIFVLFWPGGSAPRYYFPMALPLCVFGGLGYDFLSGWRPQVVAPILILTGGLLGYALVYAALSPFMPGQFAPSRIEAAQIAKLVQAAPGPIYRTGATGLNVLPYLPGRILQATSLDELAAVPGPAWMALPPDQAEAMLTRRSRKLHAVAPLGDWEDWRLLRLDP